MNDQSVFPSTSPGPFSTGSSGPGIITYVLMAVLGLGAVIFAILALTFYSKATTTTKTLNTQVAAAVAKAKADQKSADNHASELANEAPFRSYTAPTADGSFVIKFPKDWSSYVDEESSGTQVSLILNPNFVSRTNGTDDLSAAHITLQEQTSSQFMNQFTSAIKSGALHQGNITVSSQSGFDLTGKFTNHRTVREVVIPVRDKVLVFTNENSQYANEFNEILAQAKINP